MGVTSSTANSSERLPAGINNLVGELGNDIHYERGMGNSRFLKAIKARHRHGPLVVKTFVKPEAYFSLRILVRRLRIEREALADVPNTLTYQKVVETDTAGYLIRQWMSTSLYDRISTRPFLTAIEKKWITFQLLQAMRESRRRNVPHGDLKSENILVTSSLSVYITDFASSFKQVYLPLNDPSDFNFYFGTSGRRTCYIAPERFYEADSEIARQKAKARADAAASAAPGQHGTGNAQLDAGTEKLAELFRRDGKVTETMDVFSLGCVIAELWRDGAPMFTLMQLFKYREGQYDVQQALAEIPDLHTREMVASMISLDGTHRKSFAAYLSEARGVCFPDVFYTFLHRYLTTLQRTSPHAAAAKTSSEAAAAAAAAKLSVASGPSIAPTESHQSTANDANSLFRAEADERIERLYEEWSIVTRVLDGDEDALQEPSQSPNLDIHTHHLDNVGLAGRKDAPEIEANVFVGSLCIPGIDRDALQQGFATPKEDGPALLLLSPILANLRSVVRPSSKLHCIDLLLHLSSTWLTDEAKLDRVLPYLMAMLDDDSVLVRASAVRSVVQLLALVDAISPSNASAFLDYVMPNLRGVTRDPSSLVRATYAAYLYDLSQIGTRHLQITSAMRAEGVFAANADGRVGGAAADFLEGRDQDDDETNFDRQMELLRVVIQEEAVVLLADPSSNVKRSMLSQVGPLCSFLGSALTNDTILSHMITFLNDRSWLLRRAFFEALPPVARIAGARSMEDYILTLLLQALSDPEESVVLEVLYCMARVMQSSSASRRLIPQSKLYDILGASHGFLCHPNAWLRTAACVLINIGAAQLDSVETWAVLYPSLRPLLRCDIEAIEAKRLWDAAKAPLNREILLKAVQWALRAKNSLFWKTQSEEARSKAGLGTGLGREGINLFANPEGGDLPRIRLMRNEEDDAFFDGLRSAGLNDADEIKLVALREYMIKLARASSLLGQPAHLGETHHEDASIVAPLPIQSALTPQKLGNVTPLTIFFGSKSAGETVSKSGLDGETGLRSVSGRTHTIDGSYTSLIAKKRIGSSRVVSDTATLNPLEELRRRMLDLAIDNAHPLPDAPDTQIGMIGNDRDEAGSTDTVSVSQTALGKPQGKLGIGKAQAAIASTSANVAGKMADRKSKPLRTAEVDDNDARTSRAPIAETHTRTRSKLEQAADQEPVFTSTYEGDDPYIKAHLEAIWVTTFQDRFPGWGPAVSSNARRRVAARAALGAGRTPAGTISSNRRPEGNLVAYFTEHASAITDIAVSPDHAFFVSGAEDGTLKAWDTARLEKNVTSRSRSTYNGQQGRITSLIMLDGSHCVASAASDGSVHVVRIEMTTSSLASSTLPRYGKMRLVSNFQLSHRDEYVVAMAQSSRKSGLATRDASLVYAAAPALTYQPGNGPPTSSSSGSTLILATSKNRIVTLDLRTMQVLSTFQNPSQLGGISVLCTDPKNIWLLVGTMGGVLCLWDLRFQLLVKSWHISPPVQEGQRATDTRINSIALHPSKGAGRWVLVAYERLNLSFLGNRTSRCEPQVLVETWDLDLGVCVESFETVRIAAKEPASHQKAHLSRRLQTEALPAPPNPAAAIQELVRAHEEHIQTEDNQDSITQQDDVEAAHRRVHGREVIPAAPSSAAVRAIHVGLEGYASSALLHAAHVSDGWLDAGKLARSNIGDDEGAILGKAGAPAGWMLVGGLDRRIRFWDLGRVEKSTTFGSALEERSEFRLQADNGDEASSQNSAQEERQAVHADQRYETGTTTRAHSASHPQGRKAYQPVHYLHHLQPSTSASRAAASALRSPLLTQHATSASTNVLMRAHKDAITALAVIESPFRCVVAGDYSGNIRVWE